MIALLPKNNFSTSKYRASITLWNELSLKYAVCFISNEQYRHIYITIYAEMPNFFFKLRYCENAQIIMRKKSKTNKRIWILEVSEHYTTVIY